MTDPSHLDRLRAAGVPDAATDLRRLTDWAFDGVAEDDDAAMNAARDRLDAAVARRVAREPVSRIKGTRAFWRHDFDITADVLDPRPDTETLVELALQAPFDRVLDLGTGSGCILLSLLADRPCARGVGTDLSEAALQVARRNADKLGVADRTTLERSDWFGNVEGRFDLIVSNPPYISATEMAGLAPEVTEHDPAMALTPGGAGLDAYRTILSAAPTYLAPKGRLLLEIGWRQADAVSEIARSAGLFDVRVHPDLGGRDRVLSATPG